MPKPPLSLLGSRVVSPPQRATMDRVLLPPVDLRGVTTVLPPDTDTITYRPPPRGARDRYLPTPEVTPPVSTLPPLMLTPEELDVIGRSPATQAARGFTPLEQDVIAQSVPVQTARPQPAVSPVPPPPAPRQSTGNILTDTALGLTMGTLNLPGAAVGLADLARAPQRGLVNAVGEVVGFAPEQTLAARDPGVLAWLREQEATLREGLSPELQAQQATVGEAFQRGWLPGIGAALTHPRVTLQTTAESLPSMVIGMRAIGNLLAAGERAGLVAARAAGPQAVAAWTARQVAQGAGRAGMAEGLLSAGQTAQQIQQSRADAELSLADAFIAAASGATTGAITALSGRLATKLGFADFDQMVAGAQRAAPVKQSLGRELAQAGYSVLSEGGEEFFQSWQEQIAQNWLEGKRGAAIFDGMKEQAVLGALSGVLLGASAAARQTVQNQTQGIRAQAAALASRHARVVTEPQPSVPASLQTRLRVGEALAASRAARGAAAAGFGVQAPPAAEPGTSPVPPSAPPSLANLLHANLEASRAARAATAAGFGAWAGQQAVPTAEPGTSPVPTSALPPLDLTGATVVEDASTEPATLQTGAPPPAPDVRPAAELTDEEIAAEIAAQLNAEAPETPAGTAPAQIQPQPPQTQPVATDIAPDTAAAPTTAAPDVAAAPTEQALREALTVLEREGWEVTSYDPDTQQWWLDDARVSDRARASGRGRTRRVSPEATKALSTLNIASEDVVTRLINEPQYNSVIVSRPPPDVTTMTDAELRDWLDTGIGNEPAQAARELRRRSEAPSAAAAAVAPTMPEGWTTEKPTDFVRGGPSFLQPTKAKVGKGGWMIWRVGPMGAYVRETWTKNKVQQDRDRALREAPESKGPLRITESDGQTVVFENEAWRLRDVGSIGHTPTERGWVPFVVDAEGRYYYGPPQASSRQGMTGIVAMIRAINAPVKDNNGVVRQPGTEEWTRRLEELAKMEQAPTAPAPTRPQVAGEGRDVDATEDTAAETGAEAEATVPDRPVPDRWYGPAGGLQVRLNTRGKGNVEIRFPNKPSPETLKTLRGANFRWAPVDRVWYGQYQTGSETGTDSYKWRFAQRLAARAQEASAPQATPTGSPSSQPQAPSPPPTPREARAEALAPAIAETEATRAALLEEKARLIAEIKASLKKTPAGVDPTTLVPMVKLVRVYTQLGMTDAKAAWLQFQVDYGEGWEGVRRAFALAWQRFTGQPTTEADLLDVAPAEAQTQGEEQADGTDSTLASGEASAPDADRRGSGRPATPNRPARTGTRPERTEAGSSPRTDTRGTVPARQRRERGQPDDAALTPALYRITDADAIGTGGVKQRVAANLAAIRLVKQLEEEKRAATPEEQQILVKYVGWGGLSRIFEYWKDVDDTDDTSVSYWQAQDSALRGLLTHEEYATARNSTQNAHYTSPVVIRAMWRAVQQLGASQGSVLEPSGGIGHFLGLAPEDARSRPFALVEKDAISATIAKALYPGAFVQHSGYEQARLPRDHFGLAISNVPFGDIPITDPTWEGPGYLKSRIHNYFFGKALDHVAPGGLIAFITTHGTLDSRGNQAIRDYLAKRADFLGAIRLPWTAFKTNAGTEVVTDIVFLRKRHHGAAPAPVAPWTETRQVSYPDKQGAPVEQWVNEYFLAHPEMVLGTPRSTGKMRGEPTQYNVERDGKTGGQQIADWNEHAETLLTDAIHRLPADAITLEPPAESLDAFTQTQAPLGTRPFEFVIRDGRLTQVIDGKTVPVSVSGADEARIRGLLPVRAALREVYDLIAADASKAAVETAQDELSRVYDAFVKKHGYISAAENWEAFREDPDLPLLLSLEDYDAERETATKTAIFTTRPFSAQRKALQADTPAEALQIALGETNRVDLERIAELLRQPVEDATAALAAEGLIIDTPTGWQLPSQYLSGNVRVKLVEAEAAAALDPRFQTAVDRLKGVIPKDLAAHEIRVRLGASWIPQEMVTAFIADHVHTSPDRLQWKIAYNPFNAEWHIEGSPGAHTSALATPDVPFKTLLLDTLNDKRRILRREDPVTKITYVDTRATALARARREELYQAFTKWLLRDDPARQQWAVRTYNDRFNAHVEPTILSEHLTLPGMADVWRRDIAPHQRHAIARILQFGNTLLAHVVGAGKTLAMVGAGMELRRTGLARKPVYVVPNHLISQWPSEFLGYYPNAKLIVATTQDLSTPEARKRFTARVAAGDWDGVVMPYSVFVRIPMSPEVEAAYHQEMLAEIEAAIIQAAQAEAAEVKAGRARGGARGRWKQSPTIKNLEKTRDRIKKKLDEIAARPKDDLLTWEHLGVDAMFVDEADSFKNLYFHTRQEAAGIPKDSHAQRATDLYLKTRYLNRLTNNRNVVFATGTPVSNSMAEIFVMQKMLQDQALERAGISSFDAWLAQFGQIVSEPELSPTGTGLKVRPRLKNFRNLADLSQMFRQVADVKMLDQLPELKKKRPGLAGGKPEEITIPLTSEQQALLKDLEVRAKTLDPKDRRSDNMAMITGDGRLGMLDMRLLDRRRRDHKGNKITRVAKEVAAIYKTWNARKGVQLVFLDAGTPGSEKRSSAPRWTINDQGKRVKRPPTEKERYRGFDLYADLKAKLIAHGIKPEQIAFIHDIDQVPEAKQDAARKALFRKVRDGDIRVLIGSTGKMGTGMNVQDRLVALHHVDPTWKPASTEQRNGRILRQGNLFYRDDPSFEVRILNYLTQGQGTQFGLEAYMWMLNERKASIIADFFKGTVTARDLELDLDQNVLGARQFMAAATGNPQMIELGELEGALENLRLVKAGWEDAKRAAEFYIPFYKRRVKDTTAEQQKKAATAALVTRHEAGTDLTATIQGEEITGHTNIGTKVLEIVKTLTEATEAHPGKWSWRLHPQEIGTLRGLRLVLEPDEKNNPILALYPPDVELSRYGTESDTYEIPRVVLLAPDPQGPGGQNWTNPKSLLIRVNHDLDRLGETGYLSSYLADTKARLREYEQIAASTFGQQDELTKTELRVHELQKALGLGDKAHVEEQQIEDDESDDDEDQTGPPRTGGSRHASLGAVARLGPGTTGTVPASVAPTGTRTIRPVPVPELVELAQTLQATPTVVRKFRKAEKQGEFSERFGIRLTASLFQAGREPDLAATLAHEIGHLTDWLPDQVLTRGNLLGRLRTLRRFLKHTFTGPGGTIRLKDVKDELIALSAAWRPWDRATVPASFRQYRDSAAELYADALSVLLNDPGRLQAEAPTFYGAFFDAIDEKPDVQAAYFALQDLLAGTAEDVTASRRERVRGMYAAGEAKQRQLEEAQREKARAAQRITGEDIAQQILDVNAPISRRVKAAIRAGATIPEAQDPRYALEERNYLQGARKAWLDRHVVPELETLKAAGLTQTDVGELLFYERILGGDTSAMSAQEWADVWQQVADKRANLLPPGTQAPTVGDRAEIANPLGITPEIAQQLHQAMRTELGDDQWRVLQALISRTRAAVKAVAQIDPDLFTPEQHALIQGTATYAPFRVLEHLDSAVTSRIIQQIGTLKAIANPYPALVEKALVTLTAAHQNKARNLVLRFLEAQGEATPAKTRWDGHRQAPVESKDPDQVLVTVLRKGKLEGFYVAPALAKTLENHRVEAVWGAKLLGRINRASLRPVFTTLNLGFQSFNVGIRDPIRAWKASGLPFWRVLRGMLRGSRMAKLRAWGPPPGHPSTWSAKDRAAYEDLLQAEEGRILSVTFNDLIHGADVEETRLDTLLARAGLSEQAPASRWAIHRKVLEGMGHLADYFETLTKAGAILELKGSRPVKDLTPAERSLIRRKIGSPDFLQGGTWKKNTNEIFLFSNAILQAWRADLEVATDPQTRAGFWLKTAGFNLAPKLLMAAALYGWLGGTDDEDDKDGETWQKQLQRMLRRVSRYDLTNYLIVPLGEWNGKTVYLRLPQDDTGRLVGGIFWKVMQLAAERGQADDFIAAARDLFSYGSGQLPSLNPLIESGWGLVQYLSGQNPYDLFRGRPLFTPDEEMMAQDWQTFVKFLKWEADNLGLSAVTSLLPSEAGGRPWDTAADVLSDLPLAGRWLKTSDYGTLERLRETAAEVTKDEVRRRRTERREVDALVRQGGLETPGQRWSKARELATELYADAPAAERAQATRRLQQKLTLSRLRAEGDVLTDRLLSAGSNAQKVALLREGRRMMPPEAWGPWFQHARQEGVISADVARQFGAPPRATPATAVGQ